MSRIHPECPDSGSSDWAIAADVLFRQEPDEEEEEDEEESEGKEDDDDEDDEGYSEYHRRGECSWNCLTVVLD